MTPKMIRNLRPMDRETVEYIERMRGRPPAEAPKQAVSLRLDPDVIAHYKKSGAGWQSRMNAALRAHAKLKPKAKPAKSK